MPTILSENELNEIRSDVEEFLEHSGLSRTELAEKAGVPRDFLYRFLAGSYKHSPSFEMVACVVRATGRRITTVQV